LRELPSRSPVPLVGEEELEGAGGEETRYLEVAPLQQGLQRCYDDTQVACSSELNQDKMVAMLIEKVPVLTWTEYDH
jgi:hypothetical protein